jgi:steroid 5-alpha reductase family enzyme
MGPKLVITSIIITAVVFAVAWMGDQTGSELYGLPLMTAMALGIFAVQWIGLIHARLFETEHYFDLVGSLTYITVTVFAVQQAVEIGLRQQIIAGVVIVWAARLGPFLFRRIQKAGEDRRFRKIKLSTPRFLFTWTLQGTWVFLTAGAALAAIMTPNTVPLGTVFYVGAAMWVVGFAVEVIADSQKSAFKADPANENKFITTGIWARAQHPNYFGEILLWAGVAVMALPSLSGSAMIFLISPVFVAVLLTRISGVPLLRKTAGARWGDDPEYQAYLKNTPLLIPRIF